jgi:asparagine synthase (glutamine-hydrolysing)
VIVHLYEEHGIDCVHHLRGMFAFALWDGRERMLLLARDRLGQKPLYYLYYHQAGGRFWFASEIKGLLADDRVPRRMDLRSAGDYLSLRFVPPPRTMYEDIRKLPAGHLAVLADGHQDVRPYWSLDFRRKHSTDSAELLAELDRRLDDAVSSHLVADVPVGALLSGGLDSSTVVHYMAGHTDRPVTTLAIGVADGSYNELPHAELVARQYGTDHHERVAHVDLLASLPRMIWHMDEPSDPIAACMAQASALAAEHVKVVLGGDGGDELFAGFDRYLGLDLARRYRLLPSALRRMLIGPLLALLPDTFAYKSWTARLRWLHALGEHEQPGRCYAQATCFARFDHEQKRRLFSDAAWRRIEHHDSAAVIADTYDHAPADHPLDRMLHADYITRLPEHTLMLTDRTTMAHSLEARSPLLDHELVEFLAGFPPDLKVRGRELKHVLRRLMADRLPRPILRRSKQGFMFPVASWFSGEHHNFLQNTLPRSNLVAAGLVRLVRPEYVRQMIRQHHRHRQDHHVRLWLLLNLGLWHAVCIERQPIAAVEARLRDDLGRCRGLLDAAVYEPDPALAPYD